MSVAEEQHQQVPIRTVECASAAPHARLAARETNRLFQEHGLTGQPGQIRRRVILLKYAETNRDIYLTNEGAWSDAVSVQDARCAVSRAPSFSLPGSPEPFYLPEGCSLNCGCWLPVLTSGA
jgi:hypothetical protein